MNKDAEDSKEQIVARFYMRPLVREYLSSLVHSKYIDRESLKSKFEGLGKQVQSDIEDLCELLNLKITYITENKCINHESWWYTMEPMNESDYDFYLPIFFREISLYPVSYIQKSELKQFYICKSLEFSTESYSQYRAAVPDYFDPDYAMVYCAKENCVDYIINVIHHEFYHFVDYMHDGHIYGPEPKWDVLNEIDFKYGSGGANNREWKPLPNDAKGFLNYYSTTGIEEDKAETFAFMMTNTSLSINHTCNILSSKFLYHREMLREYDPIGMGNDSFWEIYLKKREAISATGLQL